MDLVVDRKKEPQFARSRKKPLGFLRESVKTKMRGPPLKFTWTAIKKVDKKNKPCRRIA